MGSLPAINTNPTNQLANITHSAAEAEEFKSLILVAIGDLPAVNMKWKRYFEIYLTRNVLHISNEVNSPEIIRYNIKN